MGSHPSTVVIVGAGPAGAALALLLTQAGIHVRLVEAKAHQRRAVRGEALMPSGLMALDAMGLLPMLPKLPSQPLAGWRFVVQGRELFSAREPLSSQPAWPCTLVNQPALLNALIELAAQTGCLELIGNATAIQLLQQNERVIGVELADGRRLLADLVVACDGRQSKLRQQAGISLISQSSPIDVLWFELEGPCPCPLQGHFTTVVGGGGIFSLFERASGGQQLGWVLDPGESTPRRSPKEWLVSFASQCSKDLAGWLQQDTIRLRGPTRLRVQVGLAESWWRPGFLLLGDAAHPMSPVRAQGINMALRDAWVASQALIPVLQVGASPDTLAISQAAIEAARRPELVHLQKLQAQETSRGELLRHHRALRCALAAGAPLIGPAIADYWIKQQQPLREGLIALPTAS